MIQVDLSDFVFLSLGTLKIVIQFILHPHSATAWGTKFFPLSNLTTPSEEAVKIPLLNTQISLILLS